MEQYENGRGSDGYVESFFFTLTEAEDFIQTYKKKKEIKIHKI